MKQKTYSINVFGDWREETHAQKKKTEYGRKKWAKVQKKKRNRLD